MKWIQKAVKRPGTLHRALEIPKETNIPVTLLNAIIKAKAGDTISNPTKTGKKKIKVTRQLESKAIFARNMRAISKKK